MLCKVPLRTLHIKVDNWANVLDLTLKWSTVTDLHITSYEADPSAVITKLVELCPFLTSLSLVLVAGRPHQPQTQYRDHTASLEWKFLRNLDIQLMEDWRHEMGDPISESLSQMLRGLRTPALEHLALDANLNGTTRQSGYTGSTMPFHDMIVLSNSPVRRLELNWFFFSNSEALSRTLESLPSLKSLKLSKSAYGWDEVVERGGNNVPGLSAILLSLCPPAIGCREIEKLELFGCEIGHIDAIISYATAAPNLKDLCVDFGSMRWESTVSLETLSSNNVREALLYLREVKGTRVIWRWPRHFVDRSLHDSPYTGLENSLPRIAYESL
ncbi:hypothetical protein V5O48_006760 [Marasmius crinis-equi]|uniref:Uncharacterized protein n=1 Tax=Marasmius crinis-equi TaxID=585013 RepID=A0ABR3FJD7_9AGAR